MLTLTGILKRLGHTDISEKVKAAKKAEEEKSARNSRNYHRHEVTEKLTALVNAVAKAKLAGVNLPDFDANELVSAVTELEQD